MNIKEIHKKWERVKQALENNNSLTKSDIKQTRTSALDQQIVMIDEFLGDLEEHEQLEFLEKNHD